MIAAPGAAAAAVMPGVRSTPSTPGRPRGRDARGVKRGEALAPSTIARAPHAASSRASLLVLSNMSDWPDILPPPELTEFLSVLDCV